MNKIENGGKEKTIEIAIMARQISKLLKLSEPHPIPIIKTFLLLQKQFNYSFIFYDVNDYEIT